MSYGTFDQYEDHSDFIVFAIFNNSVVILINIVLFLLFPISMAISSIVLMCLVNHLERVVMDHWRSTITFVLAIVFGAIGADRFYLGFPISGSIKVVIIFYAGNLIIVLAIALYLHRLRGKGYLSVIIPLAATLTVVLLSMLVWNIGDVVMLVANIKDPDILELLIKGLRVEK